METTLQSSADRGQNNAQDFFLYLVAFFSLGFVAFGEGNILFQFINKFVTDPGTKNFRVFDQGSVKFGIAALLIAAPIFFTLSKIISGRIANGKTPLESRVRRWLTYIVLFFAAGTIIGDLITLVVNFLDGDYPLGFLLKVLVVLAIAGAIFGYYFWDMRRSEVGSNVNVISAYTAIVACSVVFIAAFFIIDSPATSKQKRIDQQAVSDLQSVDSSVRNYFNQSGKLPAKLDDLGKTGFAPFLQGSEVTYRATGENTYTLCGKFLRSDKEDEQVVSGPASEEWKHDAGTVCFQRIALKNENQPLPIK